MMRVVHLENSFWDNQDKLAYQAFDDALSVFKRMLNKGNYVIFTRKDGTKYEIDTPLEWVDLTWVYVAHSHEVALGSMVKCEVYYRHRVS
jgi:hypothetical protein